MWDELKEELEVEMCLLDRLMARHPELLSKGPSDSMTVVEIDALAAFLHSFYSGIENLFKRIALAIDKTLPSGEAWHGRLLESMERPTTQRKAVVSVAMGMKLHDYLRFRHRFRHAYGFELQWTMMAPLVAVGPYWRS